MYKQFDIVWIDLNPTIWSEQNGVRPCLILQTNALSDIAQTYIIAIITSQKTEHIYPYQFKLVPNKTNGLLQVSKVKCEQIRTVDASRIIKKIWYVQDTETQKGVFSCLAKIFDSHWFFR